MANAKSVSNPAVTVAKAALYAYRMVEAGVPSAGWQRDEVIRAIGLEPGGYANRILSGMRQLGVIALSNESYSLTQLGFSLGSDPENPDLRAAAFNTCGLYNLVCRDLGTELVNEETCIPLFIRHGVVDDKASAAYEVFEESATEAGLLKAGRFVGNDDGANLDPLSLTFAVDDELQVTLKFKRPCSRRAIDELKAQMGYWYLRMQLDGRET